MSNTIRFRTLFSSMAIITILILLAPVLLGAAFAVLTYQGECYGFTDGSWACPWREYVSERVFWSVWLDVPLGIFLIASWLAALGLWLYQRRTASDRLPLPLVIAISLVGCFGGFSLMSIFSIFIRYFIGF
jgi:hypothetical protein